MGIGQLTEFRLVKIPVVLVLVVGAAIKVTWSSFVVHHAEVLQIWKALCDSLNKGTQVCNFILVHPQCVKRLHNGKFNMVGQIIVVQN